MKKFILIFIFLLNICWLPYSRAEIIHLVERGETLNDIAKKYGVTEEEIINLNPDAAQFVYTGMELIIPVNQIGNNTSTSDVPSESSIPSHFGTQVPQQSSQFNNEGEYQSNHDYVNAGDNFEQERNISVIEFHYMAGSFKHAKLSGSYGVSMNFFPWKMYDKFYAGVFLSPVNFNFGLVPSAMAGDIIKIGPSFSYYFTPRTFIAMPVAVDCGLSDFSNKVKVSWGMEISPALYLGDKAGIFFGPLLSIPFTKGAEASIGFKVGIYL